MSKQYTVATALREVGNLGKPSKMPGFSYNVPAQECKTGSKLVKVKGSVCHNCYALKGNYIRFPHVGKALYNRLDKVENNPKWIGAMAFLINWYAKKTTHFRWHDSGDIQSVEHLTKIVEVCKLTPNVKHWLPTREAKMVKKYLKDYGGSFPSNLIVRVSATMVDGAPHKFHKHTSTVVTKKTSKSYTCPAPTQGNECKDCRVCWDKRVSNVAYLEH
jgi:ribosomal protein L21E